MRKYAWIAVCGTMLSGAVVSAQPPMQNPGPYGYPGYPVQPMSRPPMGAPNWYYPPPGARMANPDMVPPDPRLPPGQKSFSPPTYGDGGPKKGAAEPYLVLPESLPTDRMSNPETAPEARPRNIVTDPFNRLIQCIAPESPTEPYTLYEGRPSAAEKHDNSRIWVQANYIHWWIRRDNTPPLVTTGDPNLPIGPAAIGSPGTSILLGNGAIGPKEFSGVQTTVGIWLDRERLESFEIGGFWLGRNSRQYRFSSDANGQPLLAQPVQIPEERVLPISFPDQQTGSIAVSSALTFHSLEANLVRNLLRVNGWSIDSLLGIRYLYLNDSLDINQNITVLPGGAGFIPFNGVGQPAGANFVFNDSFNLTNRFYGAQIGARVNWTCNRFDLGAIVKVAFGATAHVAVIDGSTTLNAGGTSTTVPGSSLAQASNIGRFTSTDFSVIPEITLTLGYQVTPNLRLLIGHTAFDWNRIQRVGNQIDRRLDVSQVPTILPTFVPGTVGTTPVFPGVRTDFWAQGINVGIELRF